MSYAVELLPAARREIKKLPEFAQKQIGSVIDRLAENPRTYGYEPLHGKLKGIFRIDTGNYRVLYEIHDKILTVLVVRVGDRKDVYKQRRR